MGTYQTLLIIASVIILYVVKRVFDKEEKLLDARFYEETYKSLEIQNKMIRELIDLTGRVINHVGSK